MSKCGKGCIPECEYFTTGGCISPFNCMYKEESEYINSATSGTVIYAVGMNMTNEEMIENLKCVIADISAQCKQLEAENAALRERLEKAVEFPFENLDKVFILAGEYTNAKQFIPDRIVEGTIVGFGYDIYEWADGNYKFNYDVLVGENNYIFALEQFNKTLFKTREAAEARLAELKGEKE